METCLKDLMRIRLIPEVADTRNDAVNIALTAELLKELEKLLSLENEDKKKPPKQVDLFEYYKGLLLRLKEDNPDEFWAFVGKASQIEDHTKARAASLSKGWVQTASSSKIVS
jgi:hypothetical protein